MAGAKTYRKSQRHLLRAGGNRTPKIDRGVPNRVRTLWRRVASERMFSGRARSVGPTVRHHAGRPSATDGLTRGRDGLDGRIEGRTDERTADCTLGRMSGTSVRIRRRTGGGGRSIDSTGVRLRAGVPPHSTVRHPPPTPPGLRPSCPSANITAGEPSTRSTDLRTQPDGALRVRQGRPPPSV